MTDYRERIKRQLPAGYDRLFGKDDDGEIGNTIRDKGGSPAVRPGPDDPDNSGDAVPRTEPEGPAAA